MLTRAFFVIALGWLAAGFASAVTVDGLYAARAPVADRSAEALESAAAEGLLQVTQRIIGQRLAGVEALAPPLRNAAAGMLLRFAYSENEAGEGLFVDMVFDRVALEKALVEAGYALWGALRPDILLWAVVEDSAGRRRIYGAQDDLAQGNALQSAARHWGLPLRLPSGHDPQGLQGLAPADVVAGYWDKIEQASARYQPELVVMSSLVFDAGAARGEWRMKLGGEEVRYPLHVALPDVDAAAQHALVFDVFVSQVVNVLASRFAIVPGEAAGVVILRIGDVISLADQVAIERYLGQLKIVKRAQVSRIAGDDLWLVVYLEGRLQQFRELVALDGRLQAVANPLAQPADANTLAVEEYRWRASGKAQAPVP